MRRHGFRPGCWTFPVFGALLTTWVACTGPNPAYEVRRRPDAAAASDAGAAADGPGADAMDDRDAPGASDAAPEAAGDAADGAFTYPAGTLVGHWRFDETSGTMAVDGSGYGNHGVLESFESANAWTTGRSAGALAFDRTRLDLGVRVPASPSVRAIQRFTIAAWTYRAANMGLHASILSRQLTGTNHESFNLTFDGPDLVLYMYPQGSGDTVEARYSIASGFSRWVHVAATFDGSTIRLYVDGILRESQPHSGQPVASDQPLYIGTNKNDPAANQVFDGRLDDVRLYAEALSGTDMDDLAED